MAARKKAAEAVNESAEKGQENESGIYLDPELVKIRDAEAKRNNVPVHPSYEEPSIDSELLKQREAEIKRGDKTIS